MNNVYEACYVLFLNLGEKFRKIVLCYKYLFERSDIRKVSLILAMWDPEHLIAMGCPDDEYDWEARRLWEKLPSNDGKFWGSETKIKNFIRNGIRDVFIEMFATSTKYNLDGPERDTEGNEIKSVNEKMKEVYSRPDYTPDWVVNSIYPIIKNI